MNIYTQFTSTMKMADVIHRNYNLIPVINRFGIEFGFGNKSVKEVCADHNINSDFFLEILNSYYNIKNSPQKRLGNFSLKMIIDYLEKTHNYYKEIKIPEIEQYIETLNTRDKKDKNKELLKDFFYNYEKELHIHLDDEDRNVFPYILKLIEADESKNYTKESFELIQNNSISKYERNHSDLESSLNDLKNLIIKFLPPVFNTDICQKLLIELYRLEEDIENHTILEDRVLIPKVKVLEKKILKNLSE